MTARQESMPADVDVAKVRYYANFEGTEQWIEVPPEDFNRLTRLFAIIGPKYQERKRGNG